MVYKLPCGTTQSSRYENLPIQKMTEAGVELDFEIFLQYVWCGPPTNRAITKALIFDVDSKQWNRGLAFFKNLRFDPNYSSVQFLPLMQQCHMEKHVLVCFCAHNKYLHDTLKMPITRQLEEARKMYLNEGNETTLSTLLLKPEVNREKLYHSTS